MMTSNLFGCWIYLINMSVIQVVVAHQLTFVLFWKDWRFRASEKSYLDQSRRNNSTLLAIQLKPECYGFYYNLLITLD